MPRYDFFCPKCGSNIEVIRPMANAGKPQKCVCGARMKRDFSGANVSKGRKQYHRPIHSQSMAVSPTQVAEHRRLFPDIAISDDGIPTFDNFSDHEKYLEKCNIEKVPQKKKRRGRRIA